jgi:hypothetical protein
MRTIVGQRLVAVFFVIVMDDLLGAQRRAIKPEGRLSPLSGLVVAFPAERSTGRAARTKSELTRMEIDTLDWLISVSFGKMQCCLLAS